MIKDIDKFLRHKVEIIDDAIKRVRNTDNMRSLAMYEVLRSKLLMMLDILNNGAVAYYDNDFALLLFTGMSKDEVIEKWHSMGRPSIQLSQCERCDDLEKLLDCIPIPGRHLVAIKQWLMEVS